MHFSPPNYPPIHFFNLSHSWQCLEFSKYVRGEVFDYIDFRWRWLNALIWTFVFHNFLYEVFWFLVSVSVWCGCLFYFWTPQEFLATVNFWYTSPVCFRESFTHQGGKIYAFNAWYDDRIDLFPNSTHQIAVIVLLEGIYYKPKPQFRNLQWHDHQTFDFKALIPQCIIFTATRAIYINEVSSKPHASIGIQWTRLIYLKWKFDTSSEEISVSRNKCPFFYSAYKNQGFWQRK